MGLFKKRKKNEAPAPKQATKKLKVTAELNSPADPNFEVIQEITYMESDEVII